MQDRTNVIALRAEPASLRRPARRITIGMQDNEPMEDDLTDSEKDAAGLGVAGFMLALGDLAERVRTGEMKLDAAVRVTGRALAFSRRRVFPGDPDVMRFAEAHLTMAQEFLALVAAEIGPGSAH